MKILAMEKETGRNLAAKPIEIYRAEARRVWELYLSGIVREIYFTRTDHTAIIMLECDSAEKAQEILASLPLVEEGIITFNIFPLEPYDGFSRLFIE